MLNSQDRLLKLETLLDRVQRNRQSLSGRRKFQGGPEVSEPSTDSFETIENEAAALAERSISEQREAPIDLVPKESESIPPNEFPETSGEHIIDENSRIVPANTEAVIMAEVDEFDGADVEEILSVAPDNVIPVVPSDAPPEPTELSEDGDLEAESIAPDDIMEIDSDDLVEDSDEELSDINIVPTMQPPKKPDYQFDDEQPETIEAAEAEEEEFDEDVEASAEEPLPLVEETGSTSKEGELELIEDDEDELEEVLDEEDIVPMAPSQAVESDAIYESAEPVPLSTAEAPAAASFVSPAEPQPEAEPRVFDSSVTASGNVATIQGGQPIAVLWTIDAVLERAWKVGTKE